MLGTQYAPVGTRFSILGTRIGYLKHLKKPGVAQSWNKKDQLYEKQQKPCGLEWTEIKVLF